MSKWTHYICEKCWRKREGDREPVRCKVELVMLDGQVSHCCFCGDATASGIFVREAPDKVLCKGACI